MARPKDRKEMSICHPDRLVQARGLCNSCYTRAKRAKELDKYPKKQSKKNKPARCHPEKKIHALDLCMYCYNRQQNLKPYDMTVKHYEDLLSAQSGNCAICLGENHLPNIVLFVDHNHTTGQVRGLLCARCNTGIGLLKDDIGIMFSAIEYLQN